MRNLKNVSLLVVTLTMAACSGLSARQEALLPAMKLAWQGVSTDVSNGVNESLTATRITAEVAAAQRADVSKMTAALDAGSAIEVAKVAWPPLKESAEFGLAQRVSRGEISTGVSGSLTERLKNFGESLKVFLERR